MEGWASWMPAASREFLPEARICMRKDICGCPVCGQGMWQAEPGPPPRSPPPVLCTQVSLSSLPVCLAAGAARLTVALRLSNFPSYCSKNVK